MQRLDLEGSLDGPESIKFLIKSTTLRNLTYLNLSNCKITDKGANDLFQSPLMLTILFLRLANCNLTEKAFPKKIQTSTNPFADNEISLEFLDFRFNTIHDRSNATSRKYLENVVILLWRKRILRRGYSYKSEVFIKSEKEMLKEDDGEVKFVENPLHIRKPSDEQYDYFNQLFN